MTAAAPQTAPDEGALLPRIQAGDVEAFGRWMAGAEPPLRRALRSFAASVDVEAVLQETFLRVWQGAPAFVPEGRDALLRFAHRVSRHLCLSELRRHHGETSLDAPGVGEAADLQAAAPPDPLLRAAIVECRERLPGKPAAALAQRLGSAGDEPDALLAARLGMTLNTFLQNFTRARKLLAECLEKRGVRLGADGGLR